MSKVNATFQFALDGDTAQLIMPDKTMVRSRCRFIDCPETNKPGQTSVDPLDINQWSWGAKSKQFLESILPTGKAIQIYQHGFDQYGRLLADWYVKVGTKRVNVAHALTEQGLATSSVNWDEVYNFVAGEVTILTGVLKRQAVARANKVGIWGDANFMISSEFKKLKVGYSVPAT